MKYYTEVENETKIATYINTNIAQKWNAYSFKEYLQASYVSGTVLGAMNMDSIEQKNHHSQVVPFKWRVSYRRI